MKTNKDKLPNVKTNLSILLGIIFLALIALTLGYIYDFNHWK